ncbi:MAG: aldo/keto reductase [Myxococcales bacterium]|nr:aldo/keto reductase [Myxococcales bacterium]MCB9691614.1 aldo/keto reductase [Alphaproteobacteria bacterium]
MQYRPLGTTGVSVSSLAMGTMAFGPDRQVDRAVFGRCREAGVNVFDCADVYNQGAAEVSLGELVHGCRDEVVLTTKAYFPSGGGVNDRGSSRYHLVRAVEASLDRLRTDRIDLFFLHRFDDRTDLASTLRAVDDLVRQGKVLYLGLSNFAAWQAQKALGVAALHGLDPAVALQPMYNLAKRQAESEILPMAASEGLAVFPYSPLGGGLLAGRYGREERPDDGRLVTNGMYATRYGAESNFALAEAFRARAAERGVHPVTLAVAWVASHPAVTAPLLGARSVAQLEPALAAADLVLGPEERASLSALSAAPAPATDRNEEGSSSDYSATLTGGRR